MAAQVEYDRKWIIFWGSWLFISANLTTTCPLLLILLRIWYVQFCVFKDPKKPKQMLNRLNCILNEVLSARNAYCNIQWVKKSKHFWEKSVANKLYVLTTTYNLFKKPWNLYSVGGATLITCSDISWNSSGIRYDSKTFLRIWLHSHLLRSSCCTL